MKRKFKVMFVISTIFFVSHGQADCQMLRPKIEKIREQNERLSQLVAANIYNTSKTMWSWYSDLSEYEGHTVRIPNRYFEPIAKSAETTQQSAINLRYGFNDLDLQLSGILKLIEKCEK